MKGENFLLAVARIASTFVGFASLVSLLRHSRGSWTTQEVRGLKLMFKFDLAATFFELLSFAGMESPYARLSLARTALRSSGRHSTTSTRPAEPPYGSNAVNGRS
jgi:hypothetical protein